MKHFDVIVLGAGGVGSAALYHLARRGIRAVGLDRFHPPHALGSSHGHTRVIRQAYFEHADYVPLLIEAYRLWRELEQQAGQRLLCQNGVVQIGPADGSVVPGVLRAAARHDLAVESLSAEGVAQRWPGLRVPAGMVAAFESTGGYLLVEDCVGAHLQAALAAGAELLPNTPVADWSATGREVCVYTPEGEIVTERLIVTSGAWAGDLLSELKLGLSVRRKSLFWFSTTDAAYDVAGGLPVFLFELPQGIFYGFPKLDGRGVKVGEHTGGRIARDPLAVDRSIDPAEQRRVIEFLAEHLPGVSRQVADHTVCFYTMSPDEHFVVDRHPAFPNVVFGAGLSGHGFKFAPVLGRALADLAIDGATALPIGFLGIDRLRRR